MGDSDVTLNPRSEARGWEADAEGKAKGDIGLGIEMLMIRVIF